MEESLVNVYAEKLENSTNKAQVLVEFMMSTLGLPKVDQKLYRIITRLNNIYGHKIIFFSILDCVEVENINTDGIHRLIAYFAKKRVYDKISDNPIKDLTPIVVKNIKELERNRKIRIPTIDWDKNV